MKKILFITIALFTFSSIFAQTKAIMLRNNGPLRVDKGNGGVEWAMEIPAGTVLELESTEPVITTLITTKESTPNIKFYKVKYQSKEYFVMASEVAIGGTFTVLLENTTLFTKPTLSAFLTAQIDKESFVVAGETVSSRGINFTEIKYWSDSSWNIKTRYVLADKVSNNQDDTKAVQILDKINGLKDLDMQLVLIENAMTLNTSSSIKDSVITTRNKIQGVFVEATPENILVVNNVKGRIDTKDGSKLNVREIPGKFTNIVGQLEDEEKVIVTYQTIQKDQIDGKKAAWYYVTNDSGTVKGWIFGAYLSLNTNAK